MFDFLTIINGLSEKDPELSDLLAEARESAHYYLLVKKRQKGCDGMGEAAALKEEFKEIMDKLIAHCKKQDNIPGSFKYDLDMAADEFVISNL